MGLFDEFEKNRDYKPFGFTTARNQKLETVVNNEDATTEVVHAFYEQFKEYAKTHPNSNIGLIAEPGSGKTFIINAFLQNLRRLDHTTFESTGHHPDQPSVQIIQTDSFGEKTNVINYDSNAVLGDYVDELPIDAKNAITQEPQDSIPVIKLVEHPTREQQKIFSFIIALSRHDLEKEMEMAYTKYNMIEMLDLKNKPRNITIQFPDDFADHAKKMVQELSNISTITPPKISTLKPIDFMDISMVEDDELYDEAISWIEMESEYNRFECNIDAEAGEIDMVLDDRLASYLHMVIHFNQDGSGLIALGEGIHLSRTQNITKEQADIIKKTAEEYIKSRPSSPDSYDHNEP